MKAHGCCWRKTPCCNLHTWSRQQMEQAATVWAWFRGLASGSSRTSEMHRVSALPGLPTSICGAAPVCQISCYEMGCRVQQDADTDLLGTYRPPEKLGWKPLTVDCGMRGPGGGARHWAVSSVHGPSLTGSSRSRSYPRLSGEEAQELAAQMRCQQRPRETPMFAVFSSFSPDRSSLHGPDLQQGSRPLQSCFSGCLFSVSRPRSLVAPSTFTHMCTGGYKQPAAYVKTGPLWQVH